jgi:hypothetical protein
VRDQHFARDGQAEAAATRSPRSRRVPAKEAIEDPLAELFRDAGPLVDDIDSDLAVGR